MRVVLVERRQRWWWNAWRAATSTELCGFADSRADAWAAMNVAINAASVPDQLAQRRNPSAIPVPRSGALAIIAATITTRTASRSVWRTPLHGVLRSGRDMALRQPPCHPEAGG
jgi:hypothetical protein